MNNASDYIKECPHGYPECLLCGEVSTSKERIRKHVDVEHLGRPEASQSTLEEVEV